MARPQTVPAVEGANGAAHWRDATCCTRVALALEGFLTYPTSYGNKRHTPCIPPSAFPRQGPGAPDALIPTLAECPESHRLGQHYQFNQPNINPTLNIETTQ
eukprot:6340627-Amphidinium_carterae.1